MMEGKRSRPPPVPFSVLRGHQDAITALSWDNYLSHYLDETQLGGYLWSGDASGMIGCWDLGSKRLKCLRTCSSVQTDFNQYSVAGVLSLLTLSRNQLGCAARTGELCVWDRDSFSDSTSTPVWKVYSGCEHFCNATSIGSSDLLIWADKSSQALVWDTRVGQEPIARLQYSRPLTIEEEEDTSIAGVARLRDNRCGMLTSIEILDTSRNTPDATSSPSDVKVLLGYEDGHLALIDLRTQNVLSVACHGNQPILNLGVSPLGDRVWSGGGEDSLLCYNIRHSSEQENCLTLEESKVTQLPAAGINSVKFRSDGRIAVSGHWDNSVRLWEAKKVKPLALCEFHRDAVSTIAFASKESGFPGLFASGSKDHTIALWNLYSDTYRES